MIFQSLLSSFKLHQGNIWLRKQRRKRDRGQMRKQISLWVWHMLPLKKSSYTLQKTKSRNSAPKIWSEYFIWSLHKPIEGEGFCLYKPQQYIDNTWWSYMYAVTDFGASCFPSRLGDSNIIPRESAGAERDHDSTPGKGEQQLSSPWALQNTSHSYAPSYSFTWAISSCKITHTSPLVCSTDLN